MTSAEHEHEKTDPLRLDRCPDCGYLLTGLPGEGICPECAFAYNPDMIVIYGWGRGQRANITNTRGRRLIMFGLLGCLWVLQVLLPGAMMLLLARDWRSVWVAVVCVVLIWDLVRRRRRNLQDSPAPVQVRLCPEGYAQRNGVGRVKLRQWRENTRLGLRRSGNQLYRVAETVSFWSWPFRLIDMEFECDSQSAERIVSRISTWRTVVPTEETSRSNSARSN